MGAVFFKTFYHITWSTKFRIDNINEEIEKQLFPFLMEKAKISHCFIHACGAYKDHIHIAIEIPPTTTISHIVGLLKGSSTYFLNRQICVTTEFSWQDGYGVLTFAERNLPQIIKYILNQKEHHTLGTINQLMEIQTERST